MGYHELTRTTISKMYPATLIWGLRKICNNLNIFQMNSSYVTRWQEGQLINETIKPMLTSIHWRKWFMIRRWQNAINKFMISMHNGVFNVTSDGVYFQWYARISVSQSDMQTSERLIALTNRNRSNNPLKTGIKFRLIVRPPLCYNVKRQSARIWQPINKHTVPNSSKKQINRGKFRSHDTAVNYYRKVCASTWRAHL